MKKIQEPSVHDRLIVALDVDTEAAAVEVVQVLSAQVRTFKVGSQLFTKCGPPIVRKIHDRGSRVFLDLKFHDIPTTVAKAGVEAARLGVFMFNVHLSGGETMIRRCLKMVGDVCEREGLARPYIIGVTLLTSICEETLRDDLGVTRTIPEQVAHFAAMAAKDGLDGVVASAREIGAIRRTCGKEFLIVTPGIRPAGTAVDDQSRIATPRWALEQGADYLVIGRPILDAPDPAQAVEAILQEMEAAQG